jgi:hypothetical protein
LESLDNYLVPFGPSLWLLFGPSSMPQTLNITPWGKGFKRTKRLARGTKWASQPASSSLSDEASTRPWQLPVDERPQPVERRRPVDERRLPVDERRLSVDERRRSEAQKEQPHQKRKSQSLGVEEPPAPHAPAKSVCTPKHREQHREDSSESCVVLEAKHPERKLKRKHGKQSVDKRRQSVEEQGKKERKQKEEKSLFFKSSCTFTDGCLKRNNSLETRVIDAPIVKKERGKKAFFKKAEERTKAKLNLLLQECAPRRSRCSVSSHRTASLSPAWGQPMVWQSRPCPPELPAPPLPAPKAWPKKRKRRK